MQGNGKAGWTTGCLFIIITALPAALAGIVWMLFMTGTPLSVPALTGAVMCMGIATANSILVVSFAREGLARGLDATTAECCWPWRCPCT